MDTVSKKTAGKKMLGFEVRNVTHERLVRIAAKLAENDDGRRVSRTEALERAIADFAKKLGVE